MRIITGTGRSGTSFVAALLHQLRYNIGAHTYPTDRPPYAGMEAPEVARLNTDIMLALRHRETHHSIYNLTPQRTLELAQEFKPRIRDFPHDLFPKDPRFNVTLPVWCAARDDIQLVILCVRPLHDVLRSAQATNTLLLHEPANNELAFFQLAARLGHLVNFLYTHPVPFRTLRFPNMVQSPGEVCANLSEIIQERGYSALCEAWRSTAKLNLVHYP